MFNHCHPTCGVLPRGNAFLVHRAPNGGSSAGCFTVGFTAVVYHF
jgi:hypothetical protein